MRRRIILVLLSLTILTVLGSLQNLADNERIARLEVYDALPSPAGLLALDEAITFTFNRRVDCAEAESALTWQPAIRGSFTCDEFSLAFAPLDQYQRNTSYSFAFTPPLQAKDGAPLLDPYRVTYLSAGYLAVAEVFPQPESKSVPVDSAITIVFDRPVVPLLASVSEDELPHPLVLSPATSGSGEWINSAVYVFTPAEPLDSVAEYTVAIAPDLAAVDGAVLESAFRWSFKTEAPSIVSIHPRPTSRHSWDRRDDIRLNPRIQLRFSQAMDRAVVERDFYFRAGLESEAIDVAGAFEWAQDGKGVAFTPDVRLWYDTEYEAGFPAGLKFSRGGRSWSYRTVRRPAIERIYPANGAIDVSSGGFSLHFASRMNIDTLRERILIKPEPDAITREYYSRFNDRYDIHFQAQPSTRYTVHIEPGMEDIYGNAISEPVTFSFTTGPLPPTLRLRVPGPVGFYSAYHGPTQLYMSHRGQEKVDLALYRVPTAEFVERLLEGDFGTWSDHRLPRPNEAELMRRWTIDGQIIENETRYDLLQLGSGDPITTAEKGPLAPGAYFLEASAPRHLEVKRNPTHYLNVSTAALTLKHTADRLTVWAVDIESGAPIVDESIHVYDQLGEYLGAALTDERGIARLQIWYTPEIWSTGLIAVLDSSEHFGIANTNWSDGMDPWDFDIRNSADERGFESYLYTDRPVYRPGQPVYFRGILRSKDDIVYLPPTLETLRITLRRRGNVVQEREVAPGDFGTIHGKFDIDPHAELGKYRVSIEYPTASGGYRKFGDSAQILVAEYRLPELQLTLSAERPEILRGATATFELKGEYFFGGPVSNASGEFTVYSIPYRFDYTGDGYYDFMDPDPYQYRYDEFRDHDDIAEGSLTTDGAGSASFDIGGAILDEPGSKRLRVEAAIRDETGQTVTDTADLIVHEGLLYVGARPERYLGRVGEDRVINIIAVDWHSQPIAGQEIDVQVIERRWTRTQTQDLTTGRIKTSWDVEEIPVTSGNALTDAEGKARFVFLPPNGGSFHVIASTRDELGNRVSATTRAWVSSRTYAHWGKDDDKKIDVVADKKEYRVGDKAQVLIASPFQGAAHALVSIERGDVLSTELVALDSNSHIHEFEILPEHAPNIYVSVFLIKPVDERNTVAAWRMGMTQLRVEPDRYELDIAISAVPENAEPQDTVAFRLRVTDWKGDPVVAEVGLALTDLAALSLGERNSEPLLETFFGPQALRVHTSSSLLNNADEVTAKLAKAMGTLAPMEDMFDCCFGGGGYSEVVPPLYLEPRSEFIDTPFWNPALITNEHGEATFSVKLPDNLTTWRLDARAVTEGRAGRFLVGENTFDLISTRPLLIRPVTPRFFTVGDVAQLAAVVNNNTASEVTADVSILNTDGLELAEPSSIMQRFTIPAGERERVTWQATILDVDSVAPKFAVLSDDKKQSDASISPVSQAEDGKLPVYRYEAQETAGTAGSLMDGGRRVEAVLLPRDSEVRSGSLDIRIDKSLAGVTNEALTSLESASRRYRECVATIVSRFLPNIVSYRAIAELGLAKPELKTKLDKLVRQGLQDLYARQRSDGGWSWCSYHKSHAPTTAYALIGLSEAKRLGYPVNQTVFWRAQRYLERQLVAPTPQADTWRLNRQAFLLYALACSGAPDVAQSATLFSHRARLNLDAVAFLAKALRVINPEDERLDALGQMMLNRAVTRASGTFFEETYHDRWNWSSNLRSTALALDALLKIRPESELLPNIVRHLVGVREGPGFWSSRQDTVWTIIALTNWMTHSGELNPEYAWSVAINDRQLSAGRALPANALQTENLRFDVSGLIRRETNLIEFERDDGAGALYYTARLNLDLPVDEIDPFSRGIEISRSYTMLGDESNAPVSGAAIGEMVQVRLRIVAPNTLRYLVVEDFFPAGAEAINPDLATSPQLGAIPSGERIDARRNGWGWWYFDHIEFHDEKAVIYVSYLPRGVYEFVYAIRPSIAGDFNVIPPIAQEMYFPEVYGRGAGTRLTISE